MKKIVLLMIAVFLSFIGLYFAWSCMLDDKYKHDQYYIIQDELAGKIVEIQTTTKRTFVLENVKQIRVGGFWFLSGTGVKDYGELWWEEMPVRVSLSNVVSYSPMTTQQFEITKRKRVSDAP